MRRKEFTLILAAVMLLALSNLPPAYGYTTVKIAEKVKHPLPSAPAPVVPGGAFPVYTLELSDSTGGGWGATISSDYGSHTLSLVNETEKGEGWLLYFRVPEGVHEGLYNLTLTQGDSQVALTRSVWVLEEWPSVLTIGHITDIHEPIGELVFPQYIVQSNLLDPDMVVVTGDIVQTESNARAWKYLQYAMLHWQIPSYFLPGNHDYSGYGGKAYSVYGGRLNYTVVVGPFVFIALDTGERGYLDSSQLQWLEQQLQSHPNKVKVIGFHHSLLSSEFEDDLGAVKGGYVEAEAGNIQALSDLIYFGWKDLEGSPLPAAEELMRLVLEYDVRVVLAGHVHRDIIYVVNGRHYFITTSTTGGGLPPTQRYGSRLVTLYSNGSVRLDPYSSTRLEEPPNNIPTGPLRYWYASSNDFTETSVTAVVENGLNMTVGDAHLVFKVSGDRPPEAYVVHGATPTRLEATPTGKGIVFDAYFQLEPGASMAVTLTSEEDSQPPQAWLQADPSEGWVKLSVSDQGWGVSQVEASYSLDGETWTPVELGLEPVLTGETIDITLDPVEAVFTPPQVGPELKVRVEASDYAGNTLTTTLSPVEETHTLAVESSPAGVEVLVDGEPHETPFTLELPQGGHTLEAPETTTHGGVEYVFKEWSGGVTSPQLSIDLEADTSVSLFYEKVEAEASEPEPGAEPQPPSGGIPLPTPFAAVGIALAALILKHLKRGRPSSSL